MSTGIGKIFITGGAGFIGCNFVRYLRAERPDWQIVNYDALTYAGNPANLADLARMTFDLVDRGAQGTYHAANDGHCTWFDLATAIVVLAGSACEVRRCSTPDHPLPAPRPMFSVLDLSATTALIGCPRHWSLAVADCVGQLIDQRVAEPR